MKLYSALMALCALQSTAAFVAQTTPKAQPSTVLHSSRSPVETRAPSRAVGKNVDRGVPRGSGPAPMKAPGGQRIRDMMSNLATEAVQGGSLRTWSFPSPAIEAVQVFLSTEGRPLNANVELWQGPDNSPQRMGVYLEDGAVRPFSALIFTPRGSNSIAIRNTANLEFPLAAYVEADNGANGVSGVARDLLNKRGRTIQGGAVYTEPFAPGVESVAVMLRTDGRPLNARIELLQGPNNNKQVMELYTEDGMDRPFMAIVETPGTGNVVRIVNTATVEFPLSANIEPYAIQPGTERFMQDGGPMSPHGSQSSGPMSMSPYGTRSGRNW